MARTMHHIMPLTVPDSPLLRDARAFGAHWAETATDYSISVGLPMTAGLTPDRPRRLLYVLDGDILFASALQATRLTSVDITAEPTPELIVVGIGWGDVGGAPAYHTLRIRDFSPSGARVPPWLAPMLGDGFPVGGAPAFHRFLAEVVDPWVRATYRVDPAPAILWGYSYGGYFALDSVIAGSPLFSDVIAGSPGIIFEDDVLFEREAAIGDRALACRVYVTIGEKEDFGKNAAYRQIALNGRRMAHLLALRKHSDFRIGFGMLSGESHHSGPVRSLLDGLQALQTMDQAE